MYSFRHRSHSNVAALSKHVWQLKERGLDYNVDWKIITKATANYNHKNFCNLCTTEKLYIISRPEMST